MTSQLSRRGRRTRQGTLGVGLGVIALLWMSTPLQLGSVTASGKRVAIVDTTVLDVQQEAVLEHVTVVIDGTRIAEIGPSARVKLEAGVERLDGRGKTVLPGLIDARVHYREWMGPLFVRFGITSILDLGNDLPWLFEQQRKIEAGELIGPRIFTTATLVAGDENTDRIVGIRDASDAEDVVNTLKERGINVIRVDGSMGAEVLRATVRASRARKLPVVSTLESSAVDAIEAGVNVLTHGPGLAAAFFSSPPREKLGVNVPGYIRQFGHSEKDASDRLRSLAVQNRVFLIDNMVSNSRGVLPHWEDIASEDLALLRRKEFAVIPEDVRARNQDYSLFQTLESKTRGEVESGYGAFGRFLKDLVAQGGALMAGSGSSTWVIPGVSLHRELELLVGHGLTSWQALRSATVMPALFLGKENETGAVKVGYRADLLVVNGNPLLDIRTTRNVVFVLKNGQVIQKPVSGGAATW